MISFNFIWRLSLARMLTYLAMTTKMNTILIDWHRSTAATRRKHNAMNDLKMKKKICAINWSWICEQFDNNAISFIEPEESVVKTNEPKWFLTHIWRHTIAICKKYHIMAWILCLSHFEHCNLYSIRLSRQWISLFINENLIKNIAHCAQPSKWYSGKIASLNTCFIHFENNAILCLTSHLAKVYNSIYFRKNAN